MTTAALNHNRCRIYAQYEKITTTYRFTCQFRVRAENYSLRKTSGSFGFMNHPYFHRLGVTRGNAYLTA